MMEENPNKNGGKSELYQEKKGGRFKKGNPGGARPKGTKNFDTIFELAIRKIVQEKKINIKDPEMEMVVKAVIESLKGNYNYYKDTMDRRYGKAAEPPQDVNLNIKTYQWGQYGNNNNLPAENMDETTS